jgi:hypothetical protein
LPGHGDADDVLHVDQVVVAVVAEVDLGEIDLAVEPAAGAAGVVGAGAFPGKASSAAKLSPRITHQG